MNKLSIILPAIFLAGMVFAAGSVYSQDNSPKPKQGVFSQVAQESRSVDGVKQITYEQFMRIRNSGEPYILMDARELGNYNMGHIDGAISFYLDSINANTAAQRLPRLSKVVTYCGSFDCYMSTKAAKKLADLGYDVLDYKGGYDEWTGKGNR